MRWYTMTLAVTMTLSMTGFAIHGQQQTVGTFLNTPESLNGYTLLSPISSRHSFLVDNCGFVVNEWSSAYYPGMVGYLLPEGDLLKAVKIPSPFNGGGSGGRIERRTWDNELTWSYNYSSSTYHQHHDIEYMPNGNILLIAWEYKARQEAIDAGRNPANINANGMWSERIVEIEPVGETEARVVWVWHIWDHLVQQFDSTKMNYGTVSAHPERIDINMPSTPLGSGDWVHFNSIDYNPHLDQIIVSSRSFNEFWIIDHSTSSLEASSHSGGNAGMGGDILYRWGNPLSYGRGTGADRKLFGQHDVHWIPYDYPDGGKIMVFNNGSGRPEGNYSSVDIIDPPLTSQWNYEIDANRPFGPSDPDWTYFGDSLTTFYSNRISGAQRLENGNTVVCSGNDGHLIEIDASGQIVWEYINPAGSISYSQGDIPQRNELFRAYRYGENFQAFENREIMPEYPLEMNYIDYDCEIYSATSPVIEGIQSPLFSIYPNPASEQIIITVSPESMLYCVLSDLSGQVMVHRHLHDLRTTIDISHLESGLYMLTLSNKKEQYFLTQKVVKI